MPATGIPLDDVATPSLLFVEQGSAPATPAAGQASLYRGTDGVWYGVDDAGVVAAVGGAVAGTGAGATKVGSKAITSAAPHTITLATDLPSLATGDLVIWMAATLNTVPNVSGPSGSGWSELWRYDTSSNEFVVAYWKIVEASPPTSWSFTTTTGTSMSSGVVALRGSMSALVHRGLSPGQYVTPSVIGSATGVQVCFWQTGTSGSGVAEIPAGDASYLSLGVATTSGQTQILAFRDITSNAAVPQFTNTGITSSTVYLASGAAVFN